MTEKEIKAGLGGRRLSELLEGGSGFELRRAHGRSELTLSGVVSVLCIADECIRLATHGGAVSVKGRGLSLSVFEERTVRIYGKIISVELGYGRT